VKLFELAEEYRADVAKLQNLDLPPEVVLDTIDSMQGEIKEKIKAVVWVAMEMKAAAEARIECAKKMLASGESEMSRSESLLTYAQIAIQNSGVTLPIKYTEFTVNLQKNQQSCDIVDTTKLPENFKHTDIKYRIAGDASNFIKAFEEYAKAQKIQLGGASVEVKAEKRLVLDALKSGVVAGAVMAPQTFRLTIK